MDLRMTLPTLSVLKTMLETPNDPLHGLEISRKTGLASGSLYPILIRLEKHKLVTSDWEDVDPTEVGRGRRRYYRLTSYGERRAVEEFARLGVTVSPEVRHA